jgi:hypothetical protein
MVAASARPRPMPAAVAPTPLGRGKARRSMGTYVLIAVPVLLAATFIWQIASSMLHTEVVVRQAVAVGRVSLESDPAGSRVDFVVVDRVGQETTFDGDVTIRLREPDGTVWQTTRTLSAADFQRLPDSSLLAGRLGYSVLVPAADWARAPRRGGLATVSISVNGGDTGPSFSTDSQQLFP